MNKKKSIIITLVILTVVVVALGVWACTRTSQPQAAAVKTTTLEKTNLQRTVSTNGTVESTYVEQVSNMTGIPVWDIDVSVGEWVEKGDRLCRLYDEKSDTWERVEATTSGTVTAINAQNGAPANGVLFTIEDTNSLRVVTNIKEADVGTVQPGMKVSIKTDATGDKEYTGTVQSIAPTAVKQSSASGTGATAAASTGSQNPEFEARVSIDSDISGLLIGMKARLNIIVEERNGVYSVPFDVLTTNANNESCVLVAADPKDGVYTVKEVPVTTGTETDFAIEISGDQLTDGMQIITDIDKVKAGDSVTLQQNGDSVTAQADTAQGDTNAQ